LQSEREKERAEALGLRALIKVLSLLALSFHAPTARSRILSHALAGAVSGNLSKWFWDKELNTFCPRLSWGTTMKLPKIQNVMYNFALY
jgi:hypothetical protein